MGFTFSEYRCILISEVKKRDTERGGADHPGKETDMTRQCVDKVPGGRYYEPQEDRAEKEQEQEWEEFQQWVADNNGIPADPELPFN